MAELHIIGEIAEAVGFSDQSLFAKWRFVAGPCWRPLEGHTEGQTQLTDKWLTRGGGEEPDTVRHPWSHPVDVHYATKGLQGWPRLELQVWDVDWLGKCNISAYGFMNVPAQAGHHELECHTWRPMGNLRRRIIDYITGQRIHLVDPSDIIGGGLHRHIIQTQSMGTIKLKLAVVMKDFQEFGVDV